VAALAAPAVAQTAPHVGYVYPAGAQQGSLLHVIVAGQQLRSSTDVYVSGAGVHAIIIRPVPMMRKLERDEILEARRRLNALRQDPATDSKPISPEDRLAARRFPGGNGDALKSETPKDKPNDPKAQTPGAAPAKPARPNAPPETAVESLSLRELECYMNIMRGAEKRQTNAQLADGVLVEIKVDPSAPLGERELRLLGPAGLSNPLRFEIGGLQEVCEHEAVGRQAEEAIAPITTPCVINGQILPGDTDRYAFQAKRGEHLVIDAHARRLIPFLADAVPGWFEPAVAVYDASGHELAFADSNRVNPDPTLLFEIPEDGQYQLEVHDALYRGREDFVYRIWIGQLPFVTQIFPLGAHAGSGAAATIEGWNLARQQILLNSSVGPPLRSTRVTQGKYRSNEILYAVDDLPEYSEPAAGESPQLPALIALPRIINGRIGAPGEIDTYRIDGGAGQELVAEVCARRLYSRLDSRLWVTDSTGNVLASNDDMDAPLAGLLTYNADSYIRLKLPARGVFCVNITDATGRGGPEYAYRLRLSAPRPDFELHIGPSALNVVAGRATPVTAQVLRKDGFDGEIELSLLGAPEGFALQGARVPRGKDSVRFTITAPSQPTDHPVALAIEGRATVGQTVLKRSAVPADDMMQAFMYHQMVPAQELLAAVIGRPNMPAVTLPDAAPVRIPAGGTAQVRVNAPARAGFGSFDLSLSDPPAGIALEKVNQSADGVTLVLSASAKAPVGMKDNLIVEIFRTGARAGSDAAAQRRLRTPLGCLPAISFEVVQP
jgi:hypothetical protein